MKLRTKLALSYALLTLLIAGVLLFAILRVSDTASGATAAATLEKAVGKAEKTVGSGKSRMRANDFHSYSEGAYLLLYNKDGTELLAGTDVFGAQAVIGQILENYKAGEIFRVNVGSSWLYGMYRRLSGGVIPHSGGSASKTGVSEEESILVLALLPEDNMVNVMSSVTKLAWILLPCMVLLATLGGWLIARQSLLPLQQITQSAREISDGYGLNQRIKLKQKGRDEVHELADTFNGMMDRLKDSFDAESRFTSDASHELRTPTAIILAECQMAEKTPQDAEALSESVDVIHRQAQKMSDLIGKLLSYTRLEQGTRKLELEKLDLGELAVSVCEDQRTVSSDRVSIETQAEPNVYVAGDAALLISLIQNLLTNAVKYGKKDGQVRVRIHREGNNACLTVRDDGAGISEEDLPNIFNRFYQADRARTNEDGGLGLGLSLAQQIARLHGGKLTASSKVGEGSKFMFTMPAL